MPNSPFKFLDAFEAGDKDLFFGRELETETLYEMTYDTKLMLLYGASGTGKTSLVQCGLANKFSNTRWQDISIRRGANINQSLIAALNQELAALGADAVADPVTGIDAVHQLTFKPIYLIFDQFEELFTYKVDGNEQQQFFDFIVELLSTKIDCKVILVMREEFIADLWDFEKKVPFLFNYRFRLERMRKKGMEEIIEHTLEKLVERKQLAVDQPEAVAALILSQLDYGGTGNELTYLQVYLDRLYQEADVRKEARPPVFNTGLIDGLGKIEDVIGDFLDSQITELEKRLGKGKRGIPIQILGSLITDERTKKVLQFEELEQIRTKYGLTQEELELCIQAFENMRILKRYES